MEDKTSVAVYEIVCKNQEQLKGSRNCSQLCILLLTLWFTVLIL